jgi:hypothetical protein
MPAMLWIVATLGLATLDRPPAAPVSRVEPVVVSARIVRGGEASSRRKMEHPQNRTRAVLEKLPDGREVSLIVFDFE